MTKRITVGELRELLICHDPDAVVLASISTGGIATGGGHAISAVQPPTNARGWHLRDGRRPVVHALFEEDWVSTTNDPLPSETVTVEIPREIVEKLRDAAGFSRWLPKHIEPLAEACRKALQGGEE